MLNAEKWKNEILAITDNCGEFAVINGEPVMCKDAACDACIFNKEIGNCGRLSIEWMLKKYAGHPKLTPQERMLCELFKDYWIARNKEGHLFLCKYKMSKSNNVWINTNDHLYTLIPPYDESNLKFSFIKWEDEEPYNTSDMLTWEVEK